MTTIAFDGVHLVTDAAAVSSGLKQPINKIHPVDIPEWVKMHLGIRDTTKASKFYWACCGVVGELEDVRQWLNGERGVDDELPKFQNNHTLGIIVEVGTSRIWSFNTSLKVFETEGITSDGSGAEFALGAMLTGANAVEAVNRAIEYTTYAGLGLSILNTKTGNFSPFIKPLSVFSKG